MALPASGTLSASQINVELGLAAGAAFSMNDAGVRGLAGKPSGLISFGDLLGKSNSVAIYNTNITVANMANGGNPYNVGYINGTGGACSNNVIVLVGRNCAVTSIYRDGLNSMFNMYIEGVNFAVGEGYTAAAYLNANGKKVNIAGAIYTMDWFYDDKILIMSGMSTAAPAAPSTILTDKVGQVVNIKLTN